jgi:hypothetical protein
MQDLLQHILLQIVVAAGRNLLESVKPELHRSQPLFVALTEKLLQQYQSADRSKDLDANLGVYMPPQLLQPLLA